MSAPVTQRVAIVGGGAAGALAAVHLLRERRERGALEIDLIDRTGSFGAGVAYGTQDPLHVLNVPAVRMGAIAGHPEHFHEWLAERGEPAAEEAFLPRGLYATYVRDLLARAEREAGAARLRRHCGEVTAIAEHFGAATAPLELSLSGGERIAADRVILALGPLTAGDPIEVPPELKATGTWISDPWAPGALEEAHRSRSVLIVGTGLSMVDVALTLGASRSDGPRIRAVSRHGLVPRRHRRSLTNVRRFHIPTETGTLEPIVAAIFAQVCRVARQGDDWRDVIDSMRPVTPAIWKALRPEEKQRFLDEYQRLWDVHRFRMAPEVADRYEALAAAGRLETGAASIVSVEPHGHRARVFLRTPGAHDLEAVEVDRVINCSGAGYDLRRQAPPVLAGLLATGRARPDELGLGLDVDEDGALLDREGLPSERLFAVGSLRKGVEWESIGITEIRDHSGAIARKIVRTGETEEIPLPTELRAVAATPTEWEAA
ncbi:MAG TPA: FAD/NAD(P)-binding protein [Solirubrobacterales bacterium]|nr:FAD/NAD(P)-binding protein [Solirubrobacterales bacterium]